MYRILRIRICEPQDPDPREEDERMFYACTEAFLSKKRGKVPADQHLEKIQGDVSADRSGARLAANQRNGDDARRPLLCLSLLTTPKCHRKHGIMAMFR